MNVKKKRYNGFGEIVNEETIYYSGNQGNIKHYPNRGWRGNQRGFFQNSRGREGGNRCKRQIYATPEGQLNLPGYDGQITRCNICDSKYHWKNECPESFSQNDEQNGDNLVGIIESRTNDCKINMFNVVQVSNNESKLKGLLRETLGCAVIDSGCSKTVAGEKWLEQYKDSLSKECRKEIKMRPSKQVFKFGDGKALESKGILRLPARIGSKPVTIETEVIDANIPMLLSKETMKRAGSVLDFNTNQAKMFGSNHKLIQTTTGHYALPLFLRCNHVI